MKKERLKEVTQDYISGSSIPILVEKKLHVLERIIWIVIVVCALSGAVAMIMYTYRRFSANPTVVSIKKDFRNWNNPFPAATGCFLDRFDEGLAYDYVERKWGINESAPKFEYYMNFVKAVSNLSYINLFDLEPYENDIEMNKLDLVEVAANVHPKISGKLITFDQEIDDQWILIMTEFGLCFTTNSKFAKLLAVTHETRKSITKFANDFDERILRCHYLNGLCYAKFDSDPLSTLRFYVHSYLDIIDATASQAVYVMENQEVEINYRMLETASDANLRSLTPSQRRCRFYDEPINEALPFYSTSLCYAGCRNQLILKICGCRPYFYHYLDGKLCNISGLLCIAYQAEFLIKSPLEIGCTCPQPCELVTYLPEAPKITVWKSGYFEQRLTFRWGLLAPTTKYNRNIIFTLEDLIVSFGGIFALCLGVSFLSIIELLFYVLELLTVLCYSEKEKRKNKWMEKEFQNEKKVIKK